MAIVVEKIEKIGPETAEIEHFHSKNGDVGGRSLDPGGSELRPLILVVLTIFENLSVGRSGPYFMVL